MAEWVIERLSRVHRKEDFQCGNESLDRFLKTLAGQYERKRFGRTFVAVAPGDNVVRGYYTCATGSFALEALPSSARRGLPRHTVPTLHLGRLAVDQSCQGRRLGETLLFHFLQSSLETSADWGVFAVDLWAIDENARAFYTRYGFVSLEDDPLHLYLPIGTVTQMFAD
jgi:GNAT superfamily N-acetyltransferase